MKRVLILYNHLFHYRIPIFDLLGESVDLTVAYSFGGQPEESHNFKILKLPVFKFKRLVIHNQSVYDLCQNFDVVIAYGDIAWLKLSTLPFRKNRKFKVIFWTIGVSASYDKRYDEINRWDKVRNFFYRKADALVFYTDYPIKKYMQLYNFERDKLFVAWNTVKVESSTIITPQKDSILFIGSLYLQKGLLHLLENYKEALRVNPDIYSLNIVGGGEEFDRINKWILENGVSHKVSLKGPIYDNKQKADFFLRAFACISPYQAGLSVLESMGYGVPFITSRDSITGGERFNITDGTNGILLKEISDIKDIILDISKSPDKYIQMGQVARSYYLAKRKPEHMTKGLLEAIQYVSKSINS
jgi:glycosyltransferase involved in cell wall biosynthesis